MEVSFEDVKKHVEKTINMDTSIDDNTKIKYEVEFVCRIIREKVVWNENAKKLDKNKLEEEYDTRFDKPVIKNIRYASRIDKHMIEHSAIDVIDYIIHQVSEKLYNAIKNGKIEYPLITFDRYKNPIVYGKRILYIKDFTIF